MNNIYEPIDNGRLAEIRNIYSARFLTDPQFEEFVSICTILNREIHRSGSFIEKLGIYAFVVSLMEKGISANRAETIIRDLFKGLFGQTMDQLRQSLLKAEARLDQESVAMAVPYAFEVLKMIEGREQPKVGITTIPFQRAYAHQAVLMATQLSITDAAAKRLMSEQFEALEDRVFDEEGKQYEARFHQSKFKAEKRRQTSQGGQESDQESAQ